MREVIFSPSARNDLAEIWTYISLDDEDAAFRVIGEIISQCEAMGETPHIGRSCDPEIGDQVMRFPIRNYMIFYRLLPDKVEIIRTVHGARDLPSLFRD